MELEEFLKSKGSWSIQNPTGIATFDNVKLEDILEFTKLHVTEALKQASEIAESVGKQYLRVSDDEDYNKDLVLNAYSLDNIK